MTHDLALKIWTLVARFLVQIRSRSQITSILPSDEYSGGYNNDSAASLEEQGVY